MFSRRLTIILCIILLICVNIVFLAVAVRRHANVGVQGYIISLVGPLQNAGHGFVDGINNIWRGYFNLVGTSYENQDLKQQLSQALYENARLKESELAYQRVSRFLEFKSGFEVHTVMAEVISYAPNAWYDAFIINCGTNDGVNVGMPVVNYHGVIGQVVAVSGNYAKVAPMVGHGNAIGARIQSNRQSGILIGSGEGVCRLEYINSGGDVKEGDVVITSGLDGVYPAGLKLGEIISVSDREGSVFAEMTVMPYVDFAALQEVMVLIDEVQRDFEGL